MMADFRSYPMIVLLLPMVAAILLFMDPPDRYAYSKQTPNTMQQRLYQRLADAGLDGDELATVGALTLGYKQDLNKELKHHFQASGAAHVLAVSGLHTGIIYGLVLWLLTLGGRFRPLHENRFGRWTISLIIMAVMWAYAWLTGMTIRCRVHPHLPPDGSVERQFPTQFCGYHSDCAHGRQHGHYHSIQPPAKPFLG